jgi:hypothetical protein
MSDRKEMVEGRGSTLAAGALGNAEEAEAEEKLGGDLEDVLGEEE